MAYWEEMTLRGFEADPTALAALIGVLGRRGRAPEAERLYNAFAERGARPSAAVLYALIGAFGRSGALEKMEHYHAQLTRLGFDADAAPAFSALIVGYCAAGALQAAVRVYCNAVARGLRLEGAALANLIRLAVRLDAAASSYAAGLRPALDTFVVLLSSCARDGRAELADALFASLPAWRLRANRAVYVAMLECQAKAARALRAEELVAQMRADGFESDTRSLSALAEVHANDANLVRATAYLQELRRSGLPPLPSAVEAFARAAEALGDQTRLNWLQQYQRTRSRAAGHQQQQQQQANSPREQTETK